MLRRGLANTAENAKALVCFVIATTLLSTSLYHYMVSSPSMKLYEDKLVRLDKLVKELFDRTELSVQDETQQRTGIGEMRAEQVLVRVQRQIEALEAILRTNETRENTVMVSLHEIFRRLDALENGTSIGSVEDNNMVPPHDYDTSKLERQLNSVEQRLWRIQFNISALERQEVPYTPSEPTLMRLNKIEEMITELQANLSALADQGAGNFVSDLPLGDEESTSASILERLNQIEETLANKTHDEFATGTNGRIQDVVDQLHKNVTALQRHNNEALSKLSALLSAQNAATPVVNQTRQQSSESGSPSKLDAEIALINTTLSDKMASLRSLVIALQEAVYNLTANDEYDALRTEVAAVSAKIQALDLVHTEDNNAVWQQALKNQSSSLAAAIDTQASDIRRNQTILAQQLSWVQSAARELLLAEWCGFLCPEPGSLPRTQYEAVGALQRHLVPANSKMYKIQIWAAAGGGSLAEGVSLAGACGGYSEVLVLVQEDDLLEIEVGVGGSMVSSSVAVPYPAGSNPSLRPGYLGGQGGGRSGVRMVRQSQGIALDLAYAGGGGGAGPSQRTKPYYDARGGDGGGCRASSGLSSYSWSGRGGAGAWCDVQDRHPFKAGQSCATSGNSMGGGGDGYYGGLCGDNGYNSVHSGGGGGAGMVNGGLAEVVGGMTSGKTDVCGVPAGKGKDGIVVITDMSKLYSALL